MIEDSNDFNEIWSTVHSLDPEASIESIAFFLFNKFFRLKYHKINSIDWVIPQDFTSYQWSGSCARCGCRVKIQLHRSENDAITNCSFVVATDEGAFLSFNISQGWVSNVTMTRNKIPYCTKVACLI